MSSSNAQSIDAHAWREVSARAAKTLGLDPRAID